MLNVAVKKLHPLAKIPVYMSNGASGCDVQACLESAIEIAPGEWAAVPTGLALEIPLGYEVQVRPRSGLAFKKGLTVLNAPGTIDSDYRGEVKVLLVNLSRVPTRVEPGDRIAQWVVQRVEVVSFVESGSLSDTARGAGGFGSTGVNQVT